MKKIILLVFCLLTLQTSYVDAKSKSKKKDKKESRYIKGFGWGILADFGRFGNFANYSTQNVYNGSTYVNDTVYEDMARPFGMSIIYFGLNNHFILKEFSKEKSLSLNVYPTVGLGFSTNRFLNLTVPLMLCYNVGCVSTYKSKKDGGVTLGLGAEYINPGVFKISENDFWNEGSERIGMKRTGSAFIQPCASIGLRYYTRGDHAQELNIKFGYHNEKPYDKFKELPAAENKSNGSFWFRLSMVNYIRY